MVVSTGPDFPSLPGMPRLSWLRFARPGSFLGGAGASGSNTVLDPATTEVDDEPVMSGVDLMPDVQDRFPEPWVSPLHTDPPPAANPSIDLTPTVSCAPRHDPPSPLIAALGFSLWRIPVFPLPLATIRVPTDTSSCPLSPHPHVKYISPGHIYSH